jgi:NAD(P)-dependent dehydrogenase (short-subunit alcohol dehydrogenase family)
MAAYARTVLNDPNSSPLHGTNKSEFVGRLKHFQAFAGCRSHTVTYSQRWPQNHRNQPTFASLLGTFERCWRRRRRQLPADWAPLGERARRCGPCQSISGMAESQFAESTGPFEDQSMPSFNAQPLPVVLITGAARRIGKAIALDMAKHGWAVAIHHRRSTSEAAVLRDEIAALGGTAALIEADLADFGALDRAVGQCATLLGAPHCLINNASEFQLDSVQSTDESTWDTHLDINLKAPVFLAQAMARRLPDGVEGNIINIIDQRVWKLTPEFFSYTISKAGLWTATRTLAQGLAPRIRVNAIGPGPVLRSVHQTDAEFTAEQTSTLLHTGPSTEEIAAAVRFILSSPSMTGQMIALDGGQHLM